MTVTGNLPEGWKMVAMSSAGSVYGGLAGKTKEDFGSGASFYVPFTNVMRNVVMDRNRLERVRVAASESQNLVRPGDVLMNGSSEVPEEVAFACLVSGGIDEPLYLNSFCFGFRPYPQPTIHPAYLAYLMRSSVGREAVRALAQGSTRYNISKSALLATKFPVPGIEEQVSIVEALDSLRALISKQEDLLAKKVQIRTASLEALLSGEAVAPLATEQTKRTRVRIDDLALPIRGVSYDPDVDLHSGDRATSVRLLRSNNVQDARLNIGEIQFVDQSRVSERQFMRPGDILVCTANGSRALVGKVAPFREAPTVHRYTFGAFMGVVRPHDVRDSEFLSWLMQSEPFRRHIDVLLSGSAINNLRPADIASFEFEAPVRAEREAIGRSLALIDADVEAARAELEKTRLVAVATLNDLITGTRRTQ